LALLKHSRINQLLGRNYQAGVPTAPHFTGMTRKTANIDIRVEPQLVEKIDAWRARWRVPPSRSAAIVSILVIAALVGGCTTIAPRQYQSSVGLVPEECRYLQAIIETREQFGIVAPSMDADREALRRCIVPESGGASQQTLPYPRYLPTATAPPGTAVATGPSQDEIQLQLNHGVFSVSVVINGAISIPFVLDSGAADVQLPAEVVLTLIRTGTLSEGDFIGASTYVLANGSTLRSHRLRIREMRVGEHIVRNVVASVGPAVSSDALLGQSFLSKLPAWTLDNKRHVLILAR
jgi:clan AA aspartic protease (TIGR02281 family)